MHCLLTRGRRSTGKGRERIGWPRPSLYPLLSIFKERSEPTADQVLLLLPPRASALGGTTTPPVPYKFSSLVTRRPAYTFFFRSLPVHATLYVLPKNVYK